MAHQYARKMYPLRDAYGYVDGRGDDVEAEPVAIGFAHGFEGFEGVVVEAEGVSRGAFFVVVGLLGLGLFVIAQRVVVFF